MNVLRISYLLLPHGPNLFCRFVKTMISRREKIPRDQQRLVFAGSGAELEDSQLIASCNLERESASACGNFEFFLLIFVHAAPSFDSHCKMRCRYRCKNAMLIKQVDPCTCHMMCVPVCFCTNFQPNVRHVNATNTMFSSFRSWWEARHQMQQWSMW
jgi:hypothetical protein